jgi:hypothetical protein
LRCISPRGYYPPVFYYYHCGDTYDGEVLVPEGIIRPCFITHCGDTNDGGVLVPEGIIRPCFITHCGDTYDGGVLVHEGITPRVVLLSLLRYL